MQHYFKVLLSAVLLSTFATVAHAADVKVVFNGEMLGTTQRYFESIAGVPRQSFGDTHVFRVQGCDVFATVSGETISALRMALNKKCRVDLSSFIGDYAPSARRALTVGAFENASGGGLDYLAECLYLCGNAYDPSVYAYWEGPRALNFVEVMLEVVLVDDKAVDAAGAWRASMTEAAGEDYVMDTRFNCDGRFNAIAAKAFKEVSVTAVTIGYDLRAPGC